MFQSYIKIWNPKTINQSYFQTKAGKLLQILKIITDLYLAQK